MTSIDLVTQKLVVLQVVFSVGKVSRDVFGTNPKTNVEPTYILVGGLEYFIFHNVWDNPSH